LTSAPAAKMITAIGSRSGHDLGTGKLETKLEHDAWDEQSNTRRRAGYSPTAGIGAGVLLLTLSHGGVGRIVSQPMIVPARHPLVGDGGRSSMSQAHISQAYTAQAYIIEVRSQSAGVVVREGGGFCFHAATAQFNALHGKTFKSPQRAHEAALQHAAARPIFQERDRGT
jgi:hypothetical protein